VSGHSLGHTADQEPADGRSTPPPEDNEVGGARFRGTENLLGGMPPAELDLQTGHGVRERITAGGNGFMALDSVVLRIDCQNRYLTIRRQRQDGQEFTGSHGALSPVGCIKDSHFG
jgi:hypothetical protein